MSVVRWLECVPNVSEGRDAEVLRTLRRSLSTAAGTRLLDASSDPDHHRSVLTLIGTSEALVGAMTGLCRTAFELVDLRHHDGVHPRLGSVDVVPFVPLAGADMQDAIEAAWSLGEKLVQRWGIPIFFYGRAALPGSASVPADLRRFGLAGLSERLRRGDLAADLGGPEVDPSRGVIMIGARPALIAYNVVLDTDRLEVATTIAGRVRASGGGLAAVQALGFELPSRGRVQVSCNLLDFETTGLAEVFAEIALAAESLGCRVLEGEIVGMMPRAAVAGLRAEEIGVSRIDPAWLIENFLPGGA